MQRLKPALQSSKGRSLPWGGAKLTNCFAEKSEGDKRDLFGVMLIPGMVSFTTLANAPVRGLHRMGDTLYAVGGARLYSISSTGVATDLGSVPGTGRVAMADNGTQLSIVSGNIGYVLSGGTISTPANLPAAVSDVAYMDGYMLWTVASNDTFVISSLNDALTYDVLDIATVEGSPDDLVGLIVDHREVQFYGKQSIEIWYNSGASDFPFERQGNAFIERGCFSRDSIVKIDNSVHFVGDDRVVYRLDGYRPVRISTHDIEYAYRNATDFWAFDYTMEGHKFYVLCTDVGTFAYDMATGAWANRESTGLANWRAGFGVHCYDEVIVGSNTTGDIYTLSLDTYSEDGETISMEIELPALEAGDGRRLTMYEFELICETGVGLSTGQGSDPQAMLTYSDDGGRTWSNEMWRSMGEIGEYTTRPTWGPLGDFYTRQMKLVITDPIRRMALGYLADMR
jgi:hypothetical protein